MAMTISIYNRAGTVLKATADIPTPPIAGGRVDYSSSTGKVTYSFTYGGAKTVSGTFTPDTSSIKGLSKSPGTSTPDYLTIGSGAPKTDSESFSLYESYEGAPAGDFTVTYSSIGSPVQALASVSELPTPLPHSYKQTSSGGFQTEAGWYYDAFFQRQALAGDVLTESVTLYAFFEGDGATIDVYSSDGDTLLGTISGAAGYSSASFGEIPEGTAQLALIAAGTGLTQYMSFDISAGVPEGAELQGLSETIGGSVTIPFNFFTVPVAYYQGSEHRLYCVAKIPTPTPTYTITYDTDGGTLESGYTNPTTGATALPETLPVVQKAGYFFAGWWLDAAFTAPAIAGTPLTGDVTLYAQLIADIASIDITLYQNKAERIRVNKKNYLVKIATISGTFRQSVNILQPTIILQYNGVPEFNYIYISTFRRYYYVTSITNINKNIYEVGCACDTLYTYDAAIRGLYAYVARNEKTFNNFLLDSMYQPQCGIVKSSGSLVSTPGWISSDNWVTSGGDSPHVVITMNGTLTNASGSEIPSPWLIPALATSVIGARSLLDIARTFYPGLGDPAIKHFLSVKWLPYRVSIKENEPIKQWNAPGVISAGYITMGTGEYASYPVTDMVQTHTWTLSVKGVRTQDPFYLNYSPYTSIFLSFLPFGRFELDTQRVFGSVPVNGEYRIYVKTRTNSMTGQSALYWGTSSRDISTYLASSSLSIDVPTLASNYNMAKIVSGAVTVVGSVASAIVSGGATVPMAVAGAGGFISTATALASAESGVTGGGEGMIDAYPKVEVFRKSLAGTAYSLRGRPLYKYVQLRALSGFTQVDSVHVEGLPSATDEEVREIEALLKEGVIL